MSNLYDDLKLNAEGYCRQCGQPLGISGQCAICATRESDKTFSLKGYNLGAPPMELATEVAGDLYEHAKSGVVDYGARSPLVDLIIQFQSYNHSLTQLVDGLQETVNKLTTENEMLKLGMSLDADPHSRVENGAHHEFTLRKQLAAARFPVVEDVFVAKAHFFYVTFATLLTREQIMFSEAALRLKIVRTPPLRNRYSVAFQPPDTDEH